MFQFSEASKKHLDTCHPDLQKLMNEVIKWYDCTILCGHRGEDDQNKAFANGNSKLEWPSGKHNSLPSKAVDAAPFPLDWNDIKRFYHFIGFVKGIAKGLRIDIRCGLDWDSDNDFKDQKFNDLPHIELV